MKTRTCFVANSSSSSFVCDLCEEEFSGWDLYPETTCENNHYFCERCAGGLNFPEPSHEEMVAFIEEHSEFENGEDKEDIEIVKEIYEEVFSEEASAEFPAKYCPICTMETINSDDLKQYLQTVTRIPDSEVLAEIKKSNKRRRKVYTPEYIQYTCEKLGKTRDEIIKEIKDKFDNYDDFTGCTGEEE